MKKGNYSKMKILWFITGNPFEGATSGWTESALKMIIKNHHELTLVDMHSKKVKTEVVEGVTVYSLKPDSRIGEQAKAIVSDVKPDVITVFGTEYAYQCDVIEACCSKWASITTIWIQGLLTDYIHYYTTGVPDDVVNHRTVKERLMGRMNLKDQIRDFTIRSQREKKALLSVQHVLGRTEWDRSVVREINTNIKYHYCNETLRDVFYHENAVWSIDGCKRHRIMTSSCAYPIKGFHFLLEAAGQLVEEYPDLEIVCPGRDFTIWSGINSIRFSSYQKFLLDIIRKNHLESRLRFLGNLSASEMKECLLGSNVFALCSTIENSSNALGEAMLLGLPIVAAKVGGTESIILEDEGILFERGDILGLADGIRRYFEDDCLAAELGKKCWEHAKKTHNPEINYVSLMNAYNEVIEGEGSIKS